MESKGKIIALDLGTRRTGVAVSDLGRQIAFAREEIEHHSTEELCTRLQKLITEEKISAIVAGFPTKLDGSETEQTQKVKLVLKALERFKLPIEIIDERLSSQFAAAEQAFTTQKKHDSRVAQVLLETYFLKCSNTR